MKTKTSIALILTVLLFASGCTSSQIIADIQIGLDAITTLLPILGTLGVPAAIQSDVATYAAATNAAFGKAATILAGPGTDPEKAALIVGSFAGIAKPLVPAQYASLVTQVAAIAQDVENFLLTLPAAKPATLGTAKTAKTTAWSTSQQTALAKASYTALTNGITLDKMKH